MGKLLFEDRLMPREVYPTPISLIKEGGRLDVGSLFKIGLPSLLSHIDDVGKEKKYRVKFPTPVETRGKRAFFHIF